MPTEIKIPAVGESVSEVQIGSWLKREGEPVKQDEPVVTIESEKATVEVNAPTAGVLTHVSKKDGDAAKVGEVIAVVEQQQRNDTTHQQAPKPPEQKEEQPAATRKASATAAPPPNRGMGGAPPQSVKPEAPQETGKAEKTNAQTVQPVNALHGRDAHAAKEEVVRMTPLRRTIAARMVEAQKTAALLTTFNEIDMSALMGLRRKHQDAFQKRYKIKLGIMSFFVKAAIDALKLVPQVNAEVRGEEIVYRNHYDIGIAVAGGKGLVVPVLRDAEHMSFSQIERAIDDFARRASESKIDLHELEGGTFTITNGGIFGSLLSTPIVNPPQSGILGLHAIQDRPIAVEGQVVIRPMMYVALTYDHRIIDGREAVTFLKRIKECIEDPARMLVET